MTKERKSQPYFEVICDTHGLVVESADEALVEAVLNEHVWNPACHNVIRRKVGPGSDVQIRASAEEWVLVSEDQHISGPLDQAIGFRGRITPTSWLPPRPDMTIESWMAEVALLVLMRDRLQWAVADALLYGEVRYGEMFSQAVEPRAAHTCANWMWVAKAVEPSRRRESLSWSHHAEVAGLPPDEQDAWLGKALTEGWTRAELREAIRKPQALVATVCICPECGQTHRRRRND